MTQATISMTFSIAEFEKLYEAVWSYTDKGPKDEGWASPELARLRDRIWIKRGEIPIIERICP